VLGEGDRLAVALGVGLALPVALGTGSGSDGGCEGVSEVTTDCSPATTTSAGLDGLGGGGTDEPAGIGVAGSTVTGGGVDVDPAGAGVVVEGACGTPRVVLRAVRSPANSPPAAA